MTKELLAKLDLNLLVVFDAVMAEGSVKHAAVRLDMNPPAVSQSLSRLREAVGVELFIRAGQGLKPTPRARQMWERVHSALGLIKTSVAGDGPFDPTLDTRNIMIDLPSGGDELIMPRLAERIPEASGLQFRISNARAFNVLNDLRFGDSWLAFDYRQVTEPGYRCEMVTEQRIALMARRGHPALAKGLDKALYQKLPQVAVASVRSSTVLPVTELLQARGMKRFVRFTVPSLMTVVGLVAKSDLVASLPVCSIKHCQHFADFEVFALPFDLPKIPFFMIWHERFDEEAGHAWLRQMLREICAEL